MAKILASSKSGRVVVSPVSAVATEAANSSDVEARRVKILAPVDTQFARFHAAVPHRQDFSSNSFVSTSSTFSVNSSFASRPGARRTTGTRVRAGAGTALHTGVADAAGAIAPITIYTAANGNPVQFQDLWDQKNGMALIVFLRHFGCPFCWEFAGQLRDVKPSLDAAGVKLIAIGVGKPDKAQLMAETINFPIECLYCDDDRKAYKALELHGDARTFFFPRKAVVPQVMSRWPSLREVFSNGYKLSITDDRRGVMQQGGLYVFKGQEVLYARKEENVVDHPDLKQVLSTYCAVPGYT